MFCNLNDEDIEKGFSDKGFNLFVQPIYSLSKKRVTCGEVLVRLKKNGLLINPDSFIPYMEETGEIVRLDLYMIEETCLEIAREIEKGNKVLPFSINISRRSLVERDLLNKIVSIVEGYGIRGGLVKFEVTESYLTGLTEDILKNIRLLRKEGFAVLMDDFGAGVSSLSSLQGMDFDVLKIDRGFLSNSWKEGRGTIIIKHVINMANELGIPTIVEGVETEDDLSGIELLGGDLIQGFFISKPVPVQDYMKTYCFYS